MSLLTHGFSAEFKEYGIAVNSLWPRTGISTAAISWILDEKALESCRIPEIMSDAAYVILTRNSSKCTGNFFIDDEVLLASGITEKDLDKYAVKPGTQLMPDFFIDNQKPKKAQL